MEKTTDVTKSLWTLEADMVFLNHGSYGATPKEILSEQQRWRDRLESQPCRFINHEAPPAIRHSASQLANFLNAAPDDIVFVENTTSGINAVLNSISFEAGDEVLVSDHIYNAVRNSILFQIESIGAKLVVASVGLPLSNEKEIVDKFCIGINKKTRLIVVDHVASVSGVVFPVSSIAKKAQEKNIPVLVDGAHAPGMLDLDVPSLGVDWYVGNCHKWLCSPKGAAFIWARKDKQTNLHPTAISHDLGKGFTFEFDKIGTRDASPWLCVPSAIEFHQKIGGAGIRQRNHEVVVSAACRLAALWQTELGAAPNLFGSLATIRIPNKLDPTRESADHIKNWLWKEKRAEVHVMPFCDHLWVRLSVHAYNTEDECLLIADMIPEALEAIANTTDPTGRLD